MPSSNLTTDPLPDAVPQARDHFTCCWLPALLGSVGALALYAVTLGGSYVYDDTILHEDPRFTHPQRWKEFLTRDYWYRDNEPPSVDQLYRPLTCITFAVEYSLHGDRPWIYHLVNWLLHAAAAAAVAELCRRLFGFRAAIAAGVLFAVHPVHVEAVAGLVGRAELLCTLASIGALILFLRPMTPIRAAAIVACLGVAILSKEQGILLPAILLALVPFRRETLRLSKIPSTSDKTDAERGALWGLVAAICLVTAAYLVFREQLLGFVWDRDALDWAVNPLIRSRGADKWLMPLVLLGRYLALLTVPLKLSLDYGSHVIGWTVNWRQPYIYLGAAALAAWVIGTVWALRRRHRAVLFCLLALAISYGIISNSLVLIGTIFGERLMYLPSAFFLILISALLARLLRPALLTAVVLALATLGSIRAFAYACLWNDPLALYLADLAAYPQSMHLHGMAVYQYLSRGDHPAALAAREIAEDCVKQVPDNWHSYEMCVAVDLRLGDFRHAEEILAGARPYPRGAGIRIAQLRTKVRAEWAKEEGREAR